MSKFKIIEVNLEEAEDIEKILEIAEEVNMEPEDLLSIINMIIEGEEEVPKCIH